MRYVARFNCAREHLRPGRKRNVSLTSGRRLAVCVRVMAACMYSYCNIVYSGGIELELHGCYLER